MRVVPILRSRQGNRGHAPPQHPTIRAFALLDHLIRPLQERRRDRQTKSLGGFEVDDQLELGRLFDGEVAWLGALEDPIHVGPGSTP
jgi:hypothetical protein